MLVLSRLPVETAHSIAKSGMRRRFFASGEYRTVESEIELFGVKLPNPFGIAAGFDKYAVLQDVVRNYGFGWIELGSFTALGGNGNEKPRWFRLSNGDCLNRMGLNCVSAACAREELEKAVSQETFAVSISKSNNSDLEGEAAIRDIVGSYQLLKNFGIYTAIDVSCPNTSDGLTFQEPRKFGELVSALESCGKGKPVVFKFSPGLKQEHLEKLVETSGDFTDGYEAVNTFREDHRLYGVGGLSGPVLRTLALETVKYLRELTDKPILGVGGISTEENSYALAQAGANAFLVFTGFCYRHKEHPYAGPRFAHKINEGHFALKLQNQIVGILIE